MRSRLLRSGPALMLAAALCFAVMGLCVKLVSDAIPVAEVVFYRSLVATLAAVAVGWRQGRRLLGVNRRMLLTRSLVGMGSMFAYFFAIARLKLGDAVLISNMSPLFVSVMSPWLLRERVPRALWSALFLGLAGVAVVAQPSGGGDAAGVAAALTSALLAAGAYVSVRALSATDTPEAIILWFSAIATATAAVVMIPGHVAPTPRQWLGLLGVGVAASAAQLLMTRAYAIGPAARVSVFGYATPVAAYVLGQAALGEPPGWRGVAATVLVVLAGIAASAVRSAPPRPTATVPDGGAPAPSREPDGPLRDTVART